MAGHERPPQRHRTIEIIDRSQQPAHRQRATASELGDSDIGEAIALIGLPDLIVPARKPHRQPIVDLAVLNRMRIAGLQNELTREVREIDREDDLTPHQVFEIDNLLNKYCKAIQDWELMEKYSALAKGRHEKDPFLISTRSFLQGMILEDTNLLGRDYRAKDNDDPQLPIGSRPSLRMLRDTEEFIKGFAFALFGGLSLLAPMILMVLHKDILTTLLTVSVSVLLFAFIVALWLADASPSTVVVTVAAYSAVLVVFVGASSGGG